jgi:hypothetical protein
MRGVVRARARGWPTGGVVSCCGLGDGGGVSECPLARLRVLACYQSPGLQRARPGQHWQEGEGTVS